MSGLKMFVVTVVMVGVASLGLSVFAPAQAEAGCLLVCYDAVELEAEINPGLECLSIETSSSRGDCLCAGTVRVENRCELEVGLPERESSYRCFQDGVLRNCTSVEPGETVHFSVYADSSDFNERVIELTYEDEVYVLQVGYLGEHRDNTPLGVGSCSSTSGNPVSFLGGLVLLGFAVIRRLKG